MDHSPFGSDWTRQWQQDSSQLGYPKHQPAFIIFLCYNHRKGKQKNEGHKAYIKQDKGPEAEMKLIGMTRAFPKRPSCCCPPLWRQ